MTKHDELSDQPILSEVRGLGADAARLTDDGRSHVTDTAGSRYLSEFGTLGFTRIPNVINAARLLEYYRRLLPILLHIAQPVQMAHQQESLEKLTDGHRLWRVDPRSTATREAQTELQTVFDTLGISDFAQSLADQIDPLVQAFAGPLEYQAAFFNLYKEGDYISAHTDVHMGDRVNIQFPATLDGVGALRVLENGYLRVHYDTPGAMTLLGPKVWHDVPPVMRMGPDAAPHRLTLTLRYMPCG